MRGGRRRRVEERMRVRGGEEGIRIGKRRGLG